MTNQYELMQAFIHGSENPDKVKQTIAKLTDKEKKNTLRTLAVLKFPIKKGGFILRKALKEMGGDIYTDSQREEHISMQIKIDELKKNDGDKKEIKSLEKQFKDLQSEHLKIQQKVTVEQLEKAEKLIKDGL